MTLIASSNDQKSKEKILKSVGLPTVGLLGIAFASLATSVVLKCMCRDKDALFAGQLIRPLLLLGLNYKALKRKESE